MRKTKLAVAISTTLLTTSAFATNGMNMEGYGPVSTAMGGTAQAYNNGLGGMMNNPATMGHGSVEGNKFQVALGSLNPTVESSHDASGAKTKSTGGPYIMPGFGFARKKNKLTYGIGIMGQGGMGTEYGKADAQGDLFSGGLSSGGYDTIANGGAFATDGTAQPNNPQGQTPLSRAEIRSEVSVGRVVVPVGYEVTDKLNVAASLDFVWAGMDLRMDMDGASFSSLMMGNGGSVSGSMANKLGVMTVPQAANNGFTAVRSVNWARFDFSDNSDYTGEAKGSGFGGKLGFTYDISPKFTIGGSYHTKTAISDLKGDATMTMNVDIDPGIANQQAPQGYSTETIDVDGKVTIEDFQWPATYAIGASYRPTNSLMFTADYKRIGWADAMKSLKMSFKANSSQSPGYAQGFAGDKVEIEMDQDWDDQNVFMLGAQWKPIKNLALRAGANLANNPVPDETMNPLFPAIVENHYTAGFGYGFAKSHVVDASLAYAPEVKQTNSNTGVTTTHSQLNWQVMYTYKWGVQRKAGF